MSQGTATSHLKRYIWEDALIAAQTAGVISNGDLLVCLKLAAGINWMPTKQNQPGLYWANEEACNAYGVGRSTYFKHVKSLTETGFLKKIGGNLIPTLPDQSLTEIIRAAVDQKKAQYRTRQSNVETTQSPLETSESLDDHPLSEDLFSVDPFSDKGCSEDQGAAAPAPNSSSSLTSSLPTSSFGFNSSDSPLLEVETGFDEEVPQSLIETVAEAVQDHRWTLEEITSRVDALSMRGRTKTDYYFDRDDVITEAANRVEDGYLGDLDELLKDSLEVFAW